MPSTKKKSYLELYRDPRWQKRRLDVMERDGFQCRMCETKTETLNVHHAYYEDGKKPWEYPLSSLITLCESCHEDEKDQVKIARKELMQFFGVNAFSSYDYEGMRGVLSVLKRIHGREDLENALWDFARYSYKRLGYSTSPNPELTESFPEFIFYEDHPGNNRNG